MWSLTIQNLRYSIRSLLKSPGFSTTAVLILALGIGAISAIISVVYAVSKSCHWAHPLTRMVLTQSRNVLVRARGLDHQNKNQGKRLCTV